MAPACNQLNRLQLGKYAEYLVKMESQVGKGTMSKKKLAALANDCGFQAVVAQLT
jgi:hypothetical protein